MSRQVVLDTETTGLSVKKGHRIIEIGCVEIINRKFAGRVYQTYLNPNRSIDKGAFEVHGLTLEFLQDKPRFAEVVDQFLEFIKDSELIIHNAEFDIGFLNHELNLLPGKEILIQDIAKIITDTLQLAKEKHPGQRINLDALVKKYGVKGYDREKHGALVDSKILGEVYLAMTGGQAKFLFEHNSSQKGLESNKVSQNLVSPKIDKRTKLVKLSEQEEKENLEYLKRMKKETGIHPLGLKKI